MTSCHETATRTGKDGDDASLGEDGAVPPTVAEGRRRCRSLTGRGSADPHPCPVDSADISDTAVPRPDARPAGARDNRADGNCDPVGLILRKCFAGASHG